MGNKEKRVANEIELLKEKFHLRLPNVKIELGKSGLKLDTWVLTMIFQSREIEIQWYPEEKYFWVVGIGRYPANPKRYKDTVKLFDDVVITLDD